MTTQSGGEERRPDVQAAGAVVTRKGKQVLLVHRPKYDDWSFPKGKLDPGEHITTCAVREVAEETGVDVHLGPPLSAQRYPVRDRSGAPRMKTVHYWVARAETTDDVSDYRRGNEIDQVEWVSYDEAVDRLTYPHDRATLRESVLVRKRTRPVVVLRHARARRRNDWKGPDVKRPLAHEGELQADALVPVLQAYGITDVISSTAARCLQTVAPFADVSGIEPVLQAALSEENADPAKIGDLARRALGGRGRVVFCSHRPVLPDLMTALQVAPIRLEPADLMVLHVRKGAVVSTEHVRL